MGNGGAILGIPFGRPPCDMLGGREVREPDGNFGKADMGGVLAPFRFKPNGELLNDMDGARGEWGGELPLVELLFPGMVRLAAAADRGDVLVPV